MLEKAAGPAKTTISIFSVCSTCLLSLMRLDYPPHPPAASLPSLINNPVSNLNGFRLWHIIYHLVQKRLIIYRVSLPNLISLSLLKEKCTTVSNISPSYGARIKWLMIELGGGGNLAAILVPLVLGDHIIAYWWDSYGSKWTPEHSISLLTSLSQPAMWSAVRDVCFWPNTMECLT